MPVFVALDKEGFEAASKAAPYSVLFIPELLPEFSPGGGGNSSSALGDAAAVAAAVAAVAAGLARSDDSKDRGGSRGVLLLSSPAVAAVGPFDETLLKLQGGGTEEEAPTLLVLSRRRQRRKTRKRGESESESGAGGGGAAARASLALPEMLWAPPSPSGKNPNSVPNALAAWSRALAEEAKTITTTTTMTATAKISRRPPSLLLAAAAASARVAVSRLPPCVFARSRAWKRARGKDRGGSSFATVSVQLVSFECRRGAAKKEKATADDGFEVRSSLSASGCARERLLETGLWRGERESESESESESEEGGVL